LFSRITVNHLAVKSDPDIGRQQGNLQR
jgi:hypothetical protein